MGPFADDTLLGLTYPHQVVGVLLRVCLVLVGDQLGKPPGEHLAQRVASAHGVGHLRRDSAQLGRCGSFVLRVVGPEGLEERRFGGETASETERLEVDVDGDAVQLDRPLDAFGRDRQQTLLEGDADDQHIGGGLAREDATSDAGGIDPGVLLTACRPVDRVAELLQLGEELGATT